MCRLFLLVLGFYWIPVRGKRDRKARVLISNHTTLVDVVVLLYMTTPAFLSKSTVLQVPLIGTICRAMQVVGVDRLNPNDKTNRKKE